MAGLGLRIVKKDAAQRLVFGWALVARKKDGEVLTDLQGDQVEAEELEKAAYRYVRVSRQGGEMHEGNVVAELIESVVFTKEKLRAMEAPDGVLPEGWWIGMQVIDEGVWGKIVDGTYSMFSIEGTAERV